MSLYQVFDTKESSFGLPIPSKHLTRQLKYSSNTGILLHSLKQGNSTGGFLRATDSLAKDTSFEKECPSRVLI